MRETRVLMGMPITVEIVEKDIEPSAALEAVFSYFKYVDEKFSTFKETSEITAINEGRLKPEDYSKDMKEVFELCEKTKKETLGYFDIVSRKGIIDPSGLVKGWSIHNAAKILKEMNFNNFFIDAGGDIQASGENSKGKLWTVGIANPFKKAHYGTYAQEEKFEQKEDVVKIIYIGNEGVATSGTYARGQHIYNPFKKAEEIHDIVSLTVIGPDIYEADRFATAAFAMGRAGINFVENLPGLEAYMIDKDGIAVMTSGFEEYTKEDRITG